MSKILDRRFEKDLGDAVIEMVTDNDDGFTAEEIIPALCYAIFKVAETTQYGMDVALDEALDLIASGEFDS